MDDSIPGAQMSVHKEKTNDPLEYEMGQYGQSNAGRIEQRGHVDGEDVFENAGRSGHESGGRHIAPVRKEDEAYGQDVHVDDD